MIARTLRQGMQAKPLSSPLMPMHALPRRPPFFRRTEPLTFRMLLAEGLTLSVSRRRAATDGLPGRSQQAIDRRSRAAVPSRTRPGRTLRLRIRAQRYGQPVHDFGAALGL